MLDVLNLVELNDLLQPDVVGDEMAFGANGEDVLLELVEVDGDVLNAGEDVCEEAAKKEVSSALSFSARL